MSTLFVRKTGLDSNDGSTAALAFLTVDKAANTVAAGDVVNVGAGVYRELVTMDTSGVSGSPITWIADIDGKLTGDAGLVVITAGDTEDPGVERSIALGISGEDITYNTFRHFTIIAGSTRGLRMTNVDSIAGLRFEDCNFQGSIADAETITITYDASTVVAPAGDGLRFLRCLFQGPVELTGASNAVADIDIDVGFEACIFAGTNDSSGIGGLRWNGTDAAGFGIGNIQVLGCTFFGIDTGVFVDDGSVVNSGFTVDVRNSRFLYCNSGIIKETDNDGAATSDFNIFETVDTALTNVTAGGDDLTGKVAGLTGGYGDLILVKKLGWSPYLPFEAMQFADQGPGSTYQSPNIGAGDATLYDANSLDFYGNPRIMGLTAVPDMGAVEAFAKPAQETSTVRSGSFAVSFTGFGFYEALVPVDAVPTTISVYGRYNSSYGTPLPKLEVLGIQGVSDQSDIMTGAADQWEQMSVTFTPTSAGVVRVRLWSQDEAGNAFFDDYRVTT